MDSMHIQAEDLEERERERLERAERERDKMTRNWRGKLGVTLVDIVIVNK